MLEEKSAKVEGLRRKFFWLYIIAALACILAATVVSLALISANKAESKAPAGNENNSPATKAPVVETSNPNEGGNTVLPPDTNTKEPTTDEKPIVIPEGAVKWVPAVGLGSGSLVLINGDHPYLAETALLENGAQQIVNVKENRTSDTKNLQVSANTIELRYAFVDALCQMADGMVQGCETTRDLMVNTGFQRDTDPNASEFYSGLSAELRMIDLTQTPTRFYQLKDPDATSVSISAWLAANCHNYGIIQRYTAAKVTQTGVAASVTQYRYVGEVHAKYMHEMNYCLEEYLDALRAYNFNKRLAITVDEQAYELYFVKESDSAEKGIPVPKDAEYEISGNNVDGYIVLVKK